MSIRKFTRARQDITKTYLLPLIASMIMGICVYIAYKLMHLITNHNPISTIFAILVGVFTYFVAIIKVNGVTERELYKFPKGAKLVALAKKMNLL
jgi:stage V sporulation protein B